jgi:hypothetical protein
LSPPGCQHLHASFILLKPAKAASSIPFLFNMPCLRLCCEFRLTGHIGNFKQLLKHRRGELTGR